MLRVLIIGASGMLGHKLAGRLQDRFDLYTTIRASVEPMERSGIFRRDRMIEGVNVENPADLVRAFERARPDVVLNAAGVIKQVPNSRDVITTLTVNSILPHRLEQMSSEFGFRLLSISTDCVFSGEKGNYSEADQPDAFDVYGRSKILGEVDNKNCLTIRTSLIGRELSTTHGLLEWFLSNRGGRVNGFARAIFSGFPTIVFADIIADLLLDHPELHGLYHISSDPIDKFSLLSLINAAYDAQVQIVRDDSFVLDRSLDSTKFREATGFTPDNWEQMIDRMASDPMPYDDLRR
jgi:dTDP-4-dehydrorhamnose reductase